MMQWYQLGEGTLGVDSEDAALAERFECIYEGCAVDAAGAVGPRVVCRVRNSARGVVVEFSDPDPLDVPAFIERVFPDRGYTTSSDRTGVVVRLPDSEASARILPDGSLVAPAGSPWQPLVANLAVNRLLRLQPGMMFFHAASVGIGDRGVMACGPKRSGKTTLALGLAARGHALLGDEVAAVRVSDAALIPFRRSLAARAGPRSVAADALIARIGGVAEGFPDGETRTRLAISDVSPTEAGRVPLTTLVILRSIATTTRVRAVSPGQFPLGAITPLAASLWGRPGGVSAIRLLRLLAGVRVFEVDAGPPDELVNRIEHLVEDG